MDSKRVVQYNRIDWIDSKYCFYIKLKYLNEAE